MESKTLVKIQLFWVQVEIVPIRNPCHVAYFILYFINICSFAFSSSALV